MQDWSDNWLLLFHPDKCVVVQVCLPWKHSEKPVYFMRRSLVKLGALVKLEVSSCENDIGVYVDEHLTFETHIETKVNTANSVMGIIRRSFTYLDEEVFTLLFKTLVRPHLEYAQSVWSPLTGFTFLNLFGLLECRHVADFNARNKSLTAKLLQQGYRYHKLRKTFSKFYRRHYELVSKFNVRLKTLLHQGLSEPEFYGDLVYTCKFKKM